MESTGDDGEQRERRAVDGLDWRPPLPPHLDSPPPAPPPPVVSESRPQPATHSGTPRTSLLIAAATGGAILGGLVSGGVVARFAQTSDSSAASNRTTAPGATLSVDQTSAIADVALHVRPSIVLVDSSKRTVGGTEHDIGSGVVIDEQGHVITNAHVVLNTDSLKVVLSDGTERPAILIGHDHPFTDVAVLQISPGRLTTVEIGDSSALHLGDTVVAIGNPLAEFDGSVSVGVISGLNRKRVFDSVRQDDLLQTDAAVNNGNSGGALLNLKGQFIGMPTAVLRQSRTGQTVEGIAFALPSNRLMAIVNRIIADGGPYPRPSLGLDHLDINDEVLQRATRLTVTEGALVTSVVVEGPGATAGILVGDVITRVGSAAVNRENPLLNALTSFDPGQTARVVLNRNGRIIELEVKLARRS
ncbi:MAG: trypsin-like peptidase domain-containing protein [Anaerolineaceae bacterium]